MSLSRTVSYQPSVGREPLHAVQVLGGAVSPFGDVAPSAGTSAHVRSLTEGLVARGVRVTVCAAARDSELRHAFTAAGAHFAATGGRTEPEAVAVLRAVCADADLVHAHGLRAGFLASLALGRRRHEVPLIVTWHTAPRTGAETDHGTRVEAARELFVRLLRRRVARAASVVLGVTTDLVDAARRSGARDARLAPVALPGPRRPESPPGSLPGGSAEPGTHAPEPPPLPGGSRTDRPPGTAAGTMTGGPGCPAGSGEYDDGEEALRHKARADIGAIGRPLLFAVGRLDRRQGYDTVLTASRAWRCLDPQPLLAIAGEGPERAALQERIEREALPVRLLGRRDDALRLLAGADIALLSARWEGRSLPAQEALRTGVPLVATEVGGIPELVGDAAVLVPYGDPDSLASAVVRLLGDPAHRAALAAAGRARAATWPTEDDTVTQVLSVYDEVTDSGTASG
ncbi:glycosyltransferase family 4 protein [Streptomyces sp. NBC_01187]|uniref:glycosyltransferase family 4 protein n=1 Tax=unclassified Streptomyces TaxID=2593676 RepID=UPI00386CC9AE